MQDAVGAGHAAQDRNESDALRPPFLSVVYVSAATTPFSDMDLALLLATSRLNNESRDITGVLLHAGGRFIQALEGPEGAVRSTLAVIAADPRHTGVWTIDERRSAARQFGSWAMGYRNVMDGERTPAPAWLGSPEALEDRSATRAGELLGWFRERAS